jgi:2'-phosphotransferase
MSTVKDTVKPTQITVHGSEKTMVHATEKAKGKGKKVEKIPMVKISKNLAYILRHAAEKEGIPIRKDGFVKLDDLLKHQRFRGVTREEVEKCVMENDKKRFIMVGTCLDDIELDGMKVDETETIFTSLESVPNQDLQWYIRANQGHSLDIDIDLDVLTEPLVCIHGTNPTAYSKIKSNGLNKMKRTHIHFAPGLPTDGVISGMRSSCQVLIYIDMKKAMQSGIQFFKSRNGVILSAGVDGVIYPEFFEKIIQLPPCPSPAQPSPTYPPPAQPSLAPF